MKEIELKARTEKMLLLLKNEKYHTEIMKYINTKSYKTDADKSILDNSIRELSKIEQQLKQYDLIEVALGKCLTDYKKDKKHGRKLMFNTACLEYIKSLNEEEAEDGIEKEEKIKSFQRFVVLIIMLFCGNKPFFLSEDIYVLCGGVLSDEHMMLIMANALSGDYNKAIKTASNEIELNRYKKD